MSKKPVTISKQTQRIWQQNWFRSIILLLIAIATFSALTLIYLELTDTSAAIEFVNDSDCPEVTLTLRNVATGEVTAVQLRPGERERIDVIADVPYEYLVNTESDPDERDMACFDRDEGTITMPGGSTETIRVTSVERIEVTPTPTSRSADDLGASALPPDE